MTAAPHTTFPDDARLWVFAAERALTAAEADHLLGEVDAFLDDWTAHGRPVLGARDLREQRFLLVAADERATGVSGCSIDSLFRRLQLLEAELGTRLTDAGPVWYRAADGAVVCVARAEFRRLAAAGAVGRDTIVFDPTIRTLGALRAGRLEMRAGDSWHARLFPAAVG